VENICEYLTQLNIAKIGLNQNENSSNVTAITASEGREIVLASLTSSELMSSTADLAEHLFHMLRFQSPRLRSIAMAPTDDLPFQTDSTAQKNRRLSRATDHTDSETSTPSARQYGLTYPSAFLDATYNSDFTIPALPVISSSLDGPNEK
jgi:hypothetical protein